MPALRPQPAVRYYDAPQMDKDLEARRQAEFEANRSASRFLAEGPGARQAQTAIPTVTPLQVPKGDVAEIAERRLVAAAADAEQKIAARLAPYGLKPMKGDGAVSRPFEAKELVHLCETNVCGIPYRAADGSRGVLLVKMTNFDSGVAVPTGGGRVHYKGVVPKANTNDEKPTLRVHGVRTDANNRVIGVDPNFTAKGLAWKVDNVDAIVAACLKSAGKTPAATAEARPAIPTPKGRPNDPRQMSRQPSARMGM